MKRLSLLLVIAMLSACGGSTNSGGGASGEAGAAASADFPTFFKANFGGTDKEQILANIDAMIDPNLGLYLVYKPGAMPLPEKVTSVAQLKETFGTIEETLVLLSCEPTEGELPYFDCDSFDKEGCIYKKLPEGERSESLQSAIDLVEESLLREYSDAEKAEAKKTDEAVTTVMVATDAFVELEFGKVNKEWKLLVINIASFDCGA